MTGVATAFLAFFVAVVGLHGTLSCLVSRRRVTTGLTFVATLVGVVLVVRIFAMMIDGTVHESIRLVRAEAILLVLFVISLFLDFAKRRHELRHAM